MLNRNYNFCPYCGKSLPKSIKNGANFCCFCGRKLINNEENLMKKAKCIICHKLVDPKSHKTIKCSYCGSMYHSICVFSWLLKYNACPMCQNVFLFPNKLI